MPKTTNRLTRFSLTSYCDCRRWLINGSAVRGTEISGFSRLSTAQRRALIEGVEKWPSRRVFPPLEPKIVNNGARKLFKGIMERQFNKRKQKRGSTKQDHLSFIKIEIHDFSSSSMASRKIFPDIFLFISVTGCQNLYLYSSTYLCVLYK